MSSSLEAERRAYSSCLRSVTIVHDYASNGTQAADVQKMPRSGRIGLDLPAERHDVVVDDAVVERDVAAPRCIEQLLARQHPARGCAQTPTAA